jgi:16S rRNA (cytidine1402-2'-O)-methyltransferase
MAPGEAGPDADAGTLFVVSTPIGNLGDFTLRAIETLKSADMILAEDTRTSRVLLDHYGIRKRPISAREQNEARMVPRVLERLANGDTVALITDAGTPLISDPGGRIVEAVRGAGYRVSPVPGASAVTAALSAAGLDTTRFTFFGFLERTGRERRDAIEEISRLRHTAVLYEAPSRVPHTLTDLAEAGAADRTCVVAREISKKFEEFREGTVAELAAYYREQAPRGEIVILVAGGSAKTFSETELEDRARALRESGLSARDVAAALVEETGLPRNALYRIALKA